MKSPQNYWIDYFKSDFKRTLFNYLTKSTINITKFKVKINEEVYWKFITDVDLSSNEINNKYFEINEEKFLNLFNFDLNDICFYGKTN
jgi:hypothetical protein